MALAETGGGQTIIPAECSSISGCIDPDRQFHIYALHSGSNQLVNLYANEATWEGFTTPLALIRSIAIPRRVTGNSAVSAFCARSDYVLTVSVDEGRAILLGRSADALVWEWEELLQLPGRSDHRLLGMALARSQNQQDGGWWGFLTYQDVTSWISEVRIDLQVGQRISQIRLRNSTGRWRSLHLGDTLPFSPFVLWDQAGPVSISQQRSGFELWSSRLVGRVARRSVTAFDDEAILGPILSLEQLSSHHGPRWSPFRLSFEDLLYSIPVRNGLSSGFAGAPLVTSLGQPQYP